MPALSEKFQIPLGSMIVDGALVLMLAFTAGQMTTRFQAMDDRLISVEQSVARQDFSPRLATVEQRLAVAERDRVEILEALHRIELKLDGKADKP